MIKVDNINKAFNENAILKNISFNVKKGDSVAIIGQSGVGKSVLIKHLNGLIQPDSGEVWIDNKNINKINYEELQRTRRYMSMVFQFGALFDSMTIEQNIAIALKSTKNLKDNKKIAEKINNSLEMVNLAKINKLMPSDISGGMKKRVGIARAISTNPKYILYDEPTTGLDPISTNEINMLLKKISKKGVTSIIVTHEMKTVYDVVNKVIMLYKGEIIFDGCPEMLKASNDKYIKYFITGKKR